MLPRCGEPSSAQPAADASLTGSKALQCLIVVCAAIWHALPELSQRPATLSDDVRVGIARFPLFDIHCLVRAPQSQDTMTGSGSSKTYATADLKMGRATRPIWGGGSGSGAGPHSARDSPAEPLRVDLGTQGPGHGGDGGGESGA